MSVLVECPACHQKQSLKNKICGCRENPDKAKKSDPVNYRIKYYLPVKQPDGSIRRIQRSECIGKSLSEAKDADAKRRVQKREKRIFEILPEALMPFEKLSEWCFEQESVRAKAYSPILTILLAIFNKELGSWKVRDISTLDLPNIPEALHDDHIFLFRGKAVKRDIRGPLKTACEKAGIPYGRNVAQGFTFHDLRHTFNAYMQRVGVPQNVIMEITGHSTREMFDRYTTIEADDLQLAANTYTGIFRSLLNHCIDQVGVNNKKADPGGQPSD